MHRRDFMQQSVVAGAAAASQFAVSASVRQAMASPLNAPRIRVGLIGCGSVSGPYLAQLSECPFVEVVSVCDIKPQRARRRAKEFEVAHHYPHIDQRHSPHPWDSQTPYSLF